MRRPGTHPLATALALVGVLATSLLVAPPAHASGVLVAPVGPDALAFHPTTAGAVRFGTVVLWANGSATTTVDLPSPATHLQFDARADRCVGGAHLEVRVDGEPVLDHEVVGGTSGNYALRGRWGPGRHHVSFRFTNDLLTPMCDRNLKLGTIVFGGPDPQDGSPYVAFPSQLVDPTTATFEPRWAGGFQYRGWSPPPVLWAPGTMRVEVDSHQANRLVLDLWRARCGELSEVRVRVDGRRLLPDERRTRWQGTLRASEVLGTASWPDGTHVVEIEMLDDAPPGCDQHVGIGTIEFAATV